MERLQALSEEMEVVAKQGGFEFKETRRMRAASRTRCWG
jgi:hypothetical protein